MSSCFQIAYLQSRDVLMLLRLRVSGRSGCDICQISLNFQMICSSSIIKAGTKFAVHAMHAIWNCWDRLSSQVGCMAYRWRAPLASGFTFMLENKSSAWDVNTDTELESEPHLTEHSFILSCRGSACGVCKPNFGDHVQAPAQLRQLQPLPRLQPLPQHPPRLLPPPLAILVRLVFCAPEQVFMTGALLSRGPHQPHWIWLLPTAASSTVSSQKKLHPKQTSAEI